MQTFGISVQVVSNFHPEDEGKLISFASSLRQGPGTYVGFRQGNELIYRFNW